MAHYLVRAIPIKDRLDALRERLESREIERLELFGRALAGSLFRARRDRDGSAIWEEEDYCQPPLAAERAAVLDRHFSRIEVEAVDKGEGWRSIDALPSLW